MTASEINRTLEEETSFASQFAELCAASECGASRPRRSHDRVFIDWLSLPLNCQAADLQRYLEDTDKDPLDTLRFWMQDRWYERLVPKDARPHERLLFTKDMEILLPLLYQQASATLSTASSPTFLEWVKSIRRLPRKLRLVHG